MSSRFFAQLGDSDSESSSSDSEAETPVSRAPVRYNHSNQRLFKLFLMKLLLLNRSYNKVTFTFNFLGFIIF